MGLKSPPIGVQCWEYCIHYSLLSTVTFNQSFSPQPTVFRFRRPQSSLSSPTVLGPHRPYLPMAASEIIGNGTHPNTMEGREFWSTIPMPVTSHFAGDESRQNYAVWWQRATIAVKQWLSIVHTATDITVPRRLVSSKSFVVTRMVALDRKCSREFFILISTMFIIRDRSREETQLHVSGGSEVAVGWKHVTEDLTRSWAFTIECRDLNKLIFSLHVWLTFAAFLYICVKGLASKLQRMKLFGLSRSRTPWMESLFSWEKVSFLCIFHLWNSSAYLLSTRQQGSAFSDHLTRWILPLIILSVFKAIKSHKMILGGDKVSRRKIADLHLCERTGFVDLANFTDDRWDYYFTAERSQIAC